MNVEKEIKKIQDRNKRVEMDKRWETSVTRRLCIALLTYLVVVTYSYLIKNYDNVLLSSIVPVIGFILSTLSLKVIRKIWQRNK